jgi:photosystem I subunit 8
LPFIIPLYVNIVIKLTLNFIIMTAAYLPSILTPLIGLIFPGLAMAFAFIYIEQDEVG